MCYYHAMKTVQSKYSFADILNHLSQQNPEEKLRIAFQLNTFVAKIQHAGEKYASKQRLRTRRTA